MTEQWRELKETITEMRDNDGTGTQQEVCKFLVNLMDVLEKQMSDSENQNKCGDLISKQAVEEINNEIPKIHELFDIAYEYNQEDSTRTELSQKCTTYLLDVWQTMGAIVDNYPSVENKGEWERVSGGSFIDVYRCSKCKHEPPKKPLPDIKTWGWDFTDFCPNCGARMKGCK